MNLLCPFRHPISFSESVKFHAGTPFQRICNRKSRQRWEHCDSREPVGGTPSKCCISRCSSSHFKSESGSTLQIFADILQSQTRPPLFGSHSVIEAASNLFRNVSIVGLVPARIWSKPIEERPCHVKLSTVGGAVPRPASLFRPCDPSVSLLHPAWSRGPRTDQRACNHQLSHAPQSSPGPVV